jgi:hypothetical protein
MELKNGTRLRSQVDDTQVIVVKGLPGDVDLSSGGHPMIDLTATPTDGLTAKDGFDGGALLGKRYTDASGELELLVSKGGSASLSLDGEVLEVKQAKALPASD